MKILVTSNHGNTLNPKEGADIRKNKLIFGLAQENEIFLLESDRYISDREQEGTNILVAYYHEYFFFGRPLSFLLDVNIDFIRNLKNILRREDIDIIQISFPYGFIATRFLLWRLNKNAIVVYDAHNVEGGAVKQLYHLEHNFLVKNLLSLYISLLEWLTVKHLTDYIISVSNEDRLCFIKKYRVDKNRIKVIPSGTTIRNEYRNYNREYLKKQMDITNVKTILFHGTYTYPPNRDAFDSIINYIAPQIRKVADNVIFLLAGNGVPIFETENVRSLGFVKDIDLLLHSADIAIVPLLRGGGTKLKILDYLGAGLPIVASKKSIEGIDIVDGRDAIIVDDINEEFIEAILSLVYDKKRCMILGQNGRSLAEEKYDWEAIGESLNTHYYHIINVVD